MLFCRRTRSQSTSGLSFRFVCALTPQEAFLRNYLQRILDEQDPDGSVPDVVPFARYASRPADPAWGAAFPKMVQTLLRYYGDWETARGNLDPVWKYLTLLDGKMNASGIANMYYYYGWSTTALMLTQQGTGCHLRQLSVRVGR